MQSEILSEAIQLLSTTHVKLSVMLVDEFPHLKLKADNVLKVLINGFKVVNNQPIGDELPAEKIEYPPITTMFGKKLDFKHTPVRAPFVVGEDEFEAFKKTVDEALDVFHEMPEKEIFEAFDGLVIRAIAKSVGLEVTPTEPEKITVPFIQQIKEAMVTKQLLDNEISNLKTGDRGIDMDKEEVTIPEAGPKDTSVSNENEVPLPDMNVASTPDLKEEAEEPALPAQNTEQKEKHNSKPNTKKK